MVKFVVESLIPVTLALGVLVGASQSANAKDRPKVHVASNGLDSESCGSKRDPCRSISQAIANAEPGSRVLVGPGRYGDINADGDFDDPGEETPVDEFCGCMIQVDKELRFESLEGAGATILDAADANVSVVEIRGLTTVLQDFGFGKPGRGFTLMRGRIGLEVPHGSGLVAGNLAVSNLRTGFQIDSDDVRVKSNLAIANGVVGFENDGPNNLFVGNVAIANGHGFRTIDGPGSLFSGNVSSGNTVHGFQLLDSDQRLEDNLVAGNVQVGVDLGFSSGNVVNRSALVGNGNCGMHFASLTEEEPFLLEARRNSIYGNGDRCAIEYLRDTPADIDARRTWWGDPAGPGVGAADGLVNIPPEYIQLDPVADKPRDPHVRKLPFQ